MKRIFDMTDAEVLELTDLGIARIIDYEAAIEGIPLLPAHPGPEPEKMSVEPDLQTVTVGPWFFLKAEDAERVLAALASCAVYDDEGWGVDRRLKLLTPGDYSYPKMGSERVLSKEKYVAIKTDLETYKSRQSEWEARDKEYRECLKKRESISKAVHDRIDEAYRRKRQVDGLRSDFARYLELAEGNAMIAMNFLLKAKPDALAEHPEMVEELCPRYFDNAKVADRDMPKDESAS